MKRICMVNIKGKNIEIDEKCVPLVNYFNSVGLDTKFCCEGHKANEPFFIMFEDYITTEKIVNFINEYSNKYDHSPFMGKFVMWARKINDKIVYNWEYLLYDKEHLQIDEETIIKL